MTKTNLFDCSSDFGPEIFSSEMANKKVLVNGWQNPSTPQHGTSRMYATRLLLADVQLAFISRWSVDYFDYLSGEIFTLVVATHIKIRSECTLVCIIEQKDNW